MDIMRIPLALLCAAVLLLSSAAPAFGAAAEPPVPPVLDDLPEIDLSSWEYMLANSFNSVGYEYEMPEYGFFEGQGIDPRVREAAQALVAAARADGVTLYISAASRNADFCMNHYLECVNLYGSAVEACRHFLPPGCNEHQLGFAIDVTELEDLSANYNREYDDSSVYGTPTYDWMMAHCAEYGFIYRYPAGKEAWFGDPCPHFHFRYVGLEAAAYITEHDLCLEEFLYLEDPSSLFVPGLNNYATY